jgi:hypothetical protein
VPLPAIVLGSLFLLVVVAALLVVLAAVRRKRQGDDRIARQGWRRLPDGSDVVAGWDGWPFAVALEPGRASDVVVGEVEGVDFTSLRWHQQEPGRGSARTDAETYNLVALRCEAHVPPLSVVRGRRVPASHQHDAAREVEVGDARWDRRWQVLGDAGAARALLTPEVRQAVDDVDDGAWVFQPGWVVRVTRWTFWAGDDGMLEEVHRAAAPWRHVPAEAWAAYGGRPRFVTTSLGGGREAGTPETGPGRGWD